MNLLAVGKQRFRLIITKRDKPYLVSVVDTLDLDEELTTKTTQSGYYLRHYVEQYLDILSEATKIEFEIGELPHDPIRLAHIAATILQSPPELKQSLLSIETSGHLLTALIQTYRFELPLLKSMLVPQSPDNGQSGPFSLN